MQPFLFTAGALLSADSADSAAQAKTALTRFLDTISLSKLVSAAILLVICIVFIKILLSATEKMLSRSKLEKNLHAFLRAAVKIVLVFLAVMLLAGTLGIDTSSLLAILSVAGLAVSLSIQDTLSNLAGAVVLLTTRPFKLGDFIEVSGKSGTVQKIGVFYTQIATPDNQLVHLPNSQVAAAQITTVTGSETRRLEITVQVSPDTDIERVKAALTRAGEHPKRDQAHPIFARLSAYADGRACYTLRLWVATADYWDVYYDVLEAIGRSFAEARIEMTYPHINVHMGS